MILRLNILLFFIFLILASTQIGFCQDSATIKIINDSLSNLNKKIDSIDLANKRQMLKTETEIKDKLNQTNSDFYNQACASLEHRKSVIDYMLIINQF